ncbi:uncharacterized protein BX663DRAFT_492015 [Cokeromyces recurvatus]|uniref:uncharacterized protein n=1 Tax=Cokeromyces recurvatus TaxID=90255 RepID=UPI002221208D|nr:uncharacterized protein BX663DRAFT_492015 [Cokeromyces recurvatus]KAI7907793.1 hypothetical protein BX663DRAFT_492015 [Cokeromyces recurvatus]
MSMLSVHSMLNTKCKRRPSVLDINNLLCSDEMIDQKSPSLSPSLTSSPASISSFTTNYTFQKQQPADNWNHHKSHPPSIQYINLASSNSHHGDDYEDVEEEEEEDYEDENHIKAKRRRANVKQLEVLNRVFNRTFFPSTQMRAELGRQLGMSPRTVQIWFQNRRQAMRTRERQRLIKLRNNHETAKSN